MEDLRVEKYGEKEVVTKKHSISKRVAAVGGVVILTLGLFGLVGCDDEDRANNNKTPVEQTEPPPNPGGAGAWYTSFLERL